jgi:hypothetical protein
VYYVAFTLHNIISSNLRSAAVPSIAAWSC